MNNPSPDTASNLADPAATATSIGQPVDSHPDPSAQHQRAPSTIAPAVVWKAREQADKDGLAPDVATASSCACGASNFQLEIPVHLLIEYRGARIMLEKEDLSVRPYLETEDWWGFCRACKYVASGDERPDWDDDEGADLHNAMRDAVQDALRLLSAAHTLTVSSTLPRERTT